jgi:uncharacterized membrane protein YkvA (DUF1232 family)
VNKLKALVCLIYVLSPVDLAPELVLGPFGLVDDVVVALVGIRSAFRS